MAGPTTMPVEAEEIVAVGATATLHVSQPWQALLGPRRFAFVGDSGVPIAGPGATVGTVGTRVPRAGLPGPTTSSEIFSLRTSLSKPGGAPVLGEISPRVPSTGDHAKGLARPRQASRGLFSPSQLCVSDGAHMGSASAAESRTRQRR